MTATPTPSISTQKSTIVRANTKAPAWLRAGLGGLAAVAPGLAARAAERLMTVTRRHTPHPNERQILDSATRLQIDELAAWSWGCGPTVILVHGWNGRATQLGALVVPLVDRGFQVVAFDFPGHGDSTGNRASFERLSESLDAIADRVERVHAIVAHSAGCVATTVAVAEGLATERLVYIAPPIGPAHWLNEFSNAVGIDDNVRQRLQSRLEQRVGKPLDAFRLSRLVASIPLPLLVVHDNDDPWVPWQSGRELADASPTASLLTTHGLGHHRILREPDVLEQIANFIEQGVTI